MTDDDGLKFFEGLLGAASEDRPVDMTGARCPKCNASDFVSVPDLYAESRARLEEGSQAQSATRDVVMTDEQIVRKFAPPTQGSALGVALAVAVPLAGLAFYIYRRFGDNAGQISAIAAAVVTVMVLLTMARKFSDKYYHARRRWSRMYMCRKCGQLVAMALLFARITACGDPVDTLLDDRVTGVTITPPSVVLNVGLRITLVATVTTGPAQLNRRVRWATGNPVVATVDTSGVLTSRTAGTTVVTATALADSSVKASAAVIVSTNGFGTLTILAINQNGKSADLSNVAGQLDVVVGADSAAKSLSRLDLILNCGGADTVVATYSPAAGGAAMAAAQQSAGPITLSFNTAGFKNGPCVLKARATSQTGTLVLSASVSITLNNPSSASAAMNTLTKRSATDAVS